MFEATVDRAARTRDWDPWVDQYTEDVEYIEHAAGTMRGREHCCSRQARHLASPDSSTRFTGR